MQWILDHLNYDELVSSVVEWIPQVVAAVLILFAYWVGSFIVRRALSAALRRSGQPENLIHLLVDKVLHAAIMVFGFVMALDQLGVNVGAAIAGLGVVGIAVGFAAQDTLSNIISGIMIFLDRPFRVNDWVTTGDEYGQVNEITVRTTRIRTNRNTWVVIPNSIIINSVLVNHSKRGELRVDVPVGIAYKEDIDQARAVLLEAMKTIPHQSSTNAPDVAVTGLGASSVDLSVRVWIDDGRHEAATNAEVVEASKKGLDAAGIEIPFPHLQLFVDEVKQPAVDNLAQLKRNEASGDQG